MKIVLIIITALLINSCDGKRELERKAEEFDVNERYHEAIREWSEVLRGYPDDVYALTNRGVDYMYVGKLNESKKDLLKASKINNKNIVALINLSDIYFREGMHDSALYFVEKCIAEKTTNDFVVIELVESENQYDVPYFFLRGKRGFIYDKMKKYDSAYRDLVYAYNRGYTIDSIKQRISSIKPLIVHDTTTHK